MANAFEPVVMAAFLMDLSGVTWSLVVPTILLIAMVSACLGLFIAVSVGEVFETQTFSNFFCLGLFAVSLRNIKCKWML